MKQIQENRVISDSVLKQIQDSRVISDSLKAQFENKSLENRKAIDDIRSLIINELRNSFESYRDFMRDHQNARYV